MMKPVNKTSGISFFFFRHHNRWLCNTVLTKQPFRNNNLMNFKRNFKHVSGIQQQDLIWCGEGIKSQLQRPVKFVRQLALTLGSGLVCVILSKAVRFVRFQPVGVCVLINEKEMNIDIIGKRLFERQCDTAGRKILFIGGVRRNSIPNNNS